MKTKLLNRYSFFTGLSLTVLSVLMFIFSISMFSATGNFPRFLIKLSELCFVLWFPFFISGIILFVAGIIFTVCKANK